jgi:hypothetical protein
MFGKRQTVAEKAPRAAEHWRKTCAKLSPDEREAAAILLRSLAAGGRATGYRYTADDLEDVADLVMDGLE